MNTPLILGFGLALLLALALLTGAIHVYFALIEDSGTSRAIWDWYVVAIVVAFLATGLASVKQLGRWDAELYIASLEKRD